MNKKFIVKENGVETDYKSLLKAVRSHKFMANYTMIYWMVRTTGEYIEGFLSVKKVRPAPNPEK
jgi:hypothetical protein